MCTFYDHNLHTHNHLWMLAMTYDGKLEEEAGAYNESNSCSSSSNEQLIGSSSLLISTVLSTQVLKGERV